MKVRVLTPGHSSPPASLIVAAVLLGLLAATGSAQNLVSLTLHPTSVANGTSSVGTVTLDSPAPAGGTVVLLSSGDPSAVIDGNATVLEGTTSAQFLVQTLSVAVSTPATIQADCQAPCAGTFSTTLTVTPHTPTRGVSGDLWADVVIGQQDFTTVTPFEVTNARLFRPGGVVVDRSVRPNRVYVYDGGNSRVLGLSHLGTCSGGTSIGQNCTVDSDCPGSSCAITEGVPADLVLGQPSFTTSACNGDGGFQTYPQFASASASTLCSVVQDQNSVEETLGFANMAVDGAGNLYVPDFDNNRVLRYNSPFTTDTVADYVWGQTDFTGHDCNRGNASPDAQSLCFRSVIGEGFTAGVWIDTAGNLWVADNSNDRVLRFPKDPSTGVPQQAADLVLGQPDFVSSGSGAGTNQLCAPTAVLVDGAGTVYVADSQLSCGLGSQGRVLTFGGTLSNGMAATGELGSNLRNPSGLQLDPGGGIWVNDTENHQFLLFVGGVLTRSLGNSPPNYSGACPPENSGVYFCYADGQCFPTNDFCSPAGSIGVDSDGNVFASAPALNDMWRFPAQPPSNYSADKRIFLPCQMGIENRVGLAGFNSAKGIAVTDTQLIVADFARLLFWDKSALANGQAGNLSIGSVVDDCDLEGQQNYGRIAVDTASPTSHLWVIEQPPFSNDGQIDVYQLPLPVGNPPTLLTTLTATASNPMPVLGGGTITWDFNLVIGAVAPLADGSKLWVADPINNRVLRISNPLTNPIVDVILGQVSVNGTLCNQGNGDEGNLIPSQNSLCKPGNVTLDPQGNVYVSDVSLELSGNERLLEFDASLFPPNPASVILGPNATRVFGRGGSFTQPTCQYFSSVYNCFISCAPLAPAFTSDGQMVLGLNAYRGVRFPAVYRKPLSSDQVDAYLDDFTSFGNYSAVFDTNGDLYTLDLDRARILVYRQPLCSHVPTATVSGGGTVCSGSQATVQAALTGTPPWSLVWSDGVTQSGIAASPASRSVSPAVPTLYSVTEVSDASCPGTSSGSALVTIGTNASISISTAVAVCPNTKGHTASVASAGSGAKYTWTITNGTITAGAGTPSITWRSGAGNPVTLGVTVKTAGCTATGSESVTNLAPSGSITAPSTVCRNTSGYNASVPDAGPGATYTWTITNGTITAGAGTDTITWSSGSASPVMLKVTVTNAAGCSASGSKNVTNTAPPSATITAPAAVCAGSAGNAASVPGAGAGAAYTWVITNGTITQGQGTRSIKFTAGSAGSATLSVTVVNSAGCSTNGSKLVTVNPTPSSTITAASSVCHNSKGNTASAPAGGSTYSWTVTNGTLTAGQGTANITFKAGASGSVTLKVTVTSSQGCKSTSSASVPINTGC